MLKELDFRKDFPIRKPNCLLSFRSLLFSSENCRIFLSIPTYFIYYFHFFCLHKLISFIRVLCITVSFPVSLSYRFSISITMILVELEFVRYALLWEILIAFRQEVQPDICCKYCFFLFTTKFRSICHHPCIFMEILNLEVFITMFFYRLE